MRIMRMKERVNIKHNNSRLVVVNAINYIPTLKIFLLKNRKKC